MRLHGPVLVGTEFNAASDEALRQGFALASGLGAGLTVCHVVPELDTVDVLFPHLAGRNAGRRRTLRETALAAVERHVVATLGEGPRDVRAAVDAGTPHAGVLAVADTIGAGLIVLGPGRTAERVVRHATVPALIARPSPPGVVVGTTDFSDPSLPALDAAAAEATRRGARLRLLHVVDIGVFALAATAGAGLPLPPATPDVIPPIGELTSAATARLEGALRRFPAATEAMVKVGPAAQQIVDLAASLPAELVVVGTHGRTGFSRLTLGSTAESVMRTAPCSVLVVRLANPPR